MLTADDLKQIRKIVDDVVDKRIDPLAKDLTDVKKRVKKIEKTTDVMIKFLDEEDVKLQKRVDNIEKHLRITSKN